jgi:catechol 2,3-dioxygenase-like lactoylglutathione lyase family enzyme
VTLRWSGLCLDCSDAEELARFYGEAFGLITLARDEPDEEWGGSPWILMGSPDGGPTLSFQAERWYEPPTWPEAEGGLPKMMHLEVQVNSVDEAVAIVVSAGGRVAPHQPPDRDPTELRVVLDPAGHPFCLCAE